MDIKKMSTEDNERVMEYVMQEPEFNLFIIGDIENYGYDQEFQTIWGAFNEQNELNGILLKYFRNFVTYSYSEKVLKEFSSIIATNNPTVVSGKKEIIDKLSPYLSPEIIKKERKQYFSCLRSLSKELTLNENYVVKRATVEDVDRLISLMSKIEEFSEIPTNRESKIKSMENKSGRAYYIGDEQGNMIATASSTAENSSSAMVVAVATHPDYRKKGLATLCVYQLCKDLLAEGKTPCLFYDNKAAGRIYRKIGFEEIGEWKMLIMDN